MLCISPCSYRLPDGKYRFYVSRKGDTPARSNAVNIHQDARVHAEYVSYTGTRILGYGLIGASVIGGLALITAGAPGATPEDEGSGALVGLGFGVGIVGGLLSYFILARKPDEGKITLLPYVGSSSAMKEGLSVGQSVGQSQPVRRFSLPNTGLRLRGRF